MSKHAPANFATARAHKPGLEPRPNDGEHAPSWFVAMVMPTGCGDAANVDPGPMVFESKPENPGECRRCDHGIERHIGAGYICPPTNHTPALILASGDAGSISPGRELEQTPTVLDEPPKAPLSATRRAEISAIVDDIREHTGHLTRRGVDASDPRDMRDALEIINRIERRIDAPCELCGLTKDRHEMIADGDGPPLLWCIDVSPDEMWLAELQRRAELRRQAAILAEREAMAREPAPRRREPKPYRTPEATAAAFLYLVSLGEPERLDAWLAARPQDVPYLLELLESKL
jgi:hypothetical protein